MPPRIDTPFRIGQGFDVHAFAPDRPLVLGGVRIPFQLGLAGHSDADALTHAAIDAVLGALALGDIGQWFPDADPAWAGADSLHLLERVLESPEVRTWRIVNLDGVVIAQKPRLQPYIPQMRRRLAGVLGVPVDCVSVKATTTERLGFTGRGEGIAAVVVVLMTNTETA